MSLHTMTTALCKKGLREVLTTVSTNVRSLTLYFEAELTSTGFSENVRNSGAGVLKAES